MGERYERSSRFWNWCGSTPYFRGQVGRPEEDRAALARAFIAKAVFDIPTTRGLIERLEVDGRLCRLEYLAFRYCWKKMGNVDAARGVVTLYLHPSP